MTYTIRTPTLDDAKGITNVHITSWIETYSGIMTDDFLVKLPESRQRRQERWEQSLQNNTAITYVAIDDDSGEVVGFTSGGPLIEGDFDVDGQLHAIYTLKSVQGNGIGRRLAEAFARAMIAAGKQSMVVWVLKDNPTRGFYQHLGAEYLTETTIHIGGVDLIEEAYIWKPLDAFRFAEPDKDA